MPSAKKVADMKPEDVQALVDELNGLQARLADVADKLAKDFPEWKGPDGEATLDGVVRILDILVEEVSETSKAGDAAAAALKAASDEKANLAAELEAANAVVKTLQNDLAQARAGGTAPTPDGFKVKVTGRLLARDGGGEIPAGTVVVLDEENARNVVAEGNGEPVGWKPKKASR